MNIIGLCQGRNSKIFYDFYNKISINYNIDKKGVLIADSFYYINDFKSKFDQENFITLKEWEVFKESLDNFVSEDSINKWSNFFADDFSLWQAVLADRRVIYGEFCKVKDDFVSRYTHEEIISLVCYSLFKIEEFINEVKPNYLFGFAPVTLLEVLIIQYCQVKRIKILLLRSSKVDDRVVFYDNLYFLPTLITSKIHSTIPIQSEYLDHAKKYLEKIQNSIITNYEGAHDPKLYFRNPNIISLLIGFILSLRNFIIKYKNINTRLDNHLPNPIFNFYYTYVFKYFRIKQLQKLYSIKTLKNISKNQNYAFFALHSEPEIALQLNGRVFTSQLDLIKNIALSLPINYKLLIKEHPRSYGLRNISFYKDLIAIPNVELVNFNFSVSELIKCSKIVFTISGNTGFEALIRKKPVIVFGYHDLSLFPESMVKTVHNMYELPKNINCLLYEYKFDKFFALKFLALIYKYSTSVNLYSSLLAKPGRIKFRELSYDNQIENIVKLFKIYNNELSDNRN
jgi:hypothetical protein